MNETDSMLLIAFHNKTNFEDTFVNKVQPDIHILDTKICFNYRKQKQLTTKSSLYRKHILIVDHACHPIFSNLSPDCVHGFCVLCLLTSVTTAATF